MKLKIARGFIYSASLLLLVTAAAKLVSASGQAHMLQLTDPILLISFHHLFWILGFLELIVAAVCFFGKRLALQAGLLACLATNFVFYRLGLVLVGYHKPSCSCLGNLTDALHIPPQTADTVMKIILGYLLFGSYTTLLWLWLQNRAIPLAKPSAGTLASVA